MPNKTQPFKFALLLLLIFPLLISAQPGGERKEIERLVNRVIDEIKEADKRIDKDPSNPTLYAERGKLYRKLYKTRYLTKYYSPFYEDKAFDTRITTIATHAIADFDKAIRKDSSAEVLKLRGEMYAVRWFDFISKFHFNQEVKDLWGEKIQKIGGREWADILESILFANPKSDEETAVLRKFLSNNDFERARKDFENALKITSNSDLTAEINENLGRLLLKRVFHVQSMLWFYHYFDPSSLNLSVLIAPNRFNYSIWGDLNQGISHLQHSNLDKDYESGVLIRHTPYFTNQNGNWYDFPTFRAGLFLKASVAFDLGNDEIALKTLNEIEKLTDQQAWNRYECDLYPLRSRVNARMKNFDAALADANESVTNTDGKYLCSSAYEPRGDAYFGKGNFQLAIADYAYRLVNSNGITMDEQSIYKKIGFSYLKLNDKENAITNLSKSLNAFRWESRLESVERRLEILRLRLSLYRQIGDEKKVIEDEKLIKDEIERRQYFESQRNVYGKVIVSNERKIRKESMQVFVFFNKNEVHSQLADERGRFYFTHLSNEPFYLNIHFDTVEKGVSIRYFWKSKKFERGNKIFGPIVIPFDQFRKMDNRNIEN